MAEIYVPKGTTDLSTVTGEAAGDTLIFANGSQAITNGLTSMAALGSGGFAKVVVLSGFTGVVGGGSYGSFTLDVSSGTEGVFSNQAGGGAWYIEAGTTDDLIDRYKHVSDSSVYFTGGTVTLFEQASGRAEFNENALVVTAHIDGGSLNIAYRASAVTLLNAAGGQVTCQRDMTTLNVNGGTVMVGRETPQATMPVATTVTVNNGVLTWQGGNITTLNVWGEGRVDFSKASKAITVGTVNVTKRAAKRSSWNDAATGGLVTYSTKNVYGGLDNTLG